MYWIQKTYPDISVFWVHASNADRFRAAYASIAEKCNIPGRDDPKSDVLLLVKKWFEEQTKMQWIMIIDNADDIALFFPFQRSDDLDARQQEDKLARYIPDCNHGSILITTRNKQVGVKFCQGSPSIEVTKMTDDEAQQLVQSILKTDISTVDISNLVSKLEHLPLALAQATSFIQENTISVGDYVQLLDEGDTALVDQLSEPFETMGRDSETPQALTTTWIISFRQIEQIQPLAGDTLYVLSLLHHQAIPKIFIEEYFRQQRLEDAQSSVSVELIKALGTLKAFSFISEGEDGSVDMHRLVQLVTRKWLVSKSRMTEFAECATKIVSSSYPFGGFDTYQTCLKYLPHVNSVLARVGTNSRAEKIDRALLLHKLSRYYHHKGEWKVEEQCLLSAAEVQSRELGEEHPETLSCKCDLAFVYRNQGRLNEAEDLTSQTFKTMKRVLGEEDPETLNSLANLALTYEVQGRFQEAEELLVQVTEIRKRVFGEDHLVTIDGMGNLASIYAHQGRLKEAEVLALRVTKMTKRLLGEDHPQTLISINKLGLVYKVQGRLREAEDAELHAADISSRVLGEDHLFTLICRGNLASTYAKQHRWKEAEDLEMKVVEGKRRLLGEEHRETLISMNNLAALYDDQGRWKEAEDLGMRVLELGKKVLGEEHPITLFSKRNRACLLKTLGRSADAIALIEECASAEERVLGGEHPRTVLSFSILDKWRRET